MGLLGCGGERGTLAPAPEAFQPAAVETILVATTRVPEPEPAYFGANRSNRMRFVGYDISIPPARQSGTIQYPDPDHPDPAKAFVITKHMEFFDDQALVLAINISTAAKRPRSGEGAVFVHGYNVNFAEGLLRGAQFVHDTARPGVRIFYSWPSAARLRAYLNDRESVLFARDGLAQTLRLAARSELSNFSVVAHSMGTLLVMDTLRSNALAGEAATLRKIEAVAPISADIEIDVFVKQAPPSSRPASRSTFWSPMMTEPSRSQPGLEANATGSAISVRARNSADLMSPSSIFRRCRRQVQRITSRWRSRMFSCPISGVSTNTASMPCTMSVRPRWLIWALCCWRAALADDKCSLTDGIVAEKFSVNPSARLEQPVPLNVRNRDLQR